MALAELKSFIEDRLRALDPSRDLEPGSPAQVQFVEPLLAYLGSDPMETDIDAFIVDRYAQEYPDQYSADPSVIRDTFIKPLITLLEPFKREIQSIKRGQTARNPELLSDDDADALAANVFEEREPGGYAVGTARVFFPQPSNQQVELTNRVFTADGLNFFPTTPVQITAEQMVFNRDGNLFFMDIPVRAENQGAEYNIEPGSLTGVDGLFGAIKVTNTRKFSDGKARLDTTSFLANTRNSLTERSLVTRRGASARIPEVFQTDIRAVQIIGARDPEMQRDILVAASPGHSWITGTVLLSGSIALVQASVLEGEESDVPAKGDTLYVYLNKTSFPGLSQASRFVSLQVEELLDARATSSPFQYSYLIRFSGSFPPGVTAPTSSQGGIRKKGVIRVSSLPDTGPVSLQVPNGEVHVYGHTDIYARPTLQDSSKAVLSSLSDEKSFIERETLKTTADSNVVQDDSINFQSNGVSPGDSIIVETGDDAGTYPIGAVGSGTPGQLFLTSKMTVTDGTGKIRYRIQKKVRVNPFEPKVRKFPFGTNVANDLITAIGSTTFKLLGPGSDLLVFGAKAGDVIRVLSGSDKGDFVIQSFVGGGKEFIVDRPATSSNANLTYEVFTPLQKVELPLVRIKELLVLDSAQQSTGITIPPAEPVAVVPTSNFTSARIRGESSRDSGYVLPDFAGYVSGGNVAAPSGDRRYSLGFDQANGNYRSVQFPDGSFSEFDFRADANGSCCYFLATSEHEDELKNFPPVDPRPGECLTIKTGPNKGSYLIENVVKFKHKNSDGNDVWSYFIKIYGTFKYDIFRSLIKFLDDASVASGNAAIGVSKIVGSADVPFPDFFRDIYDALGAKLHNALLYYGVTSPGAPTLQASIVNLTRASYEWGDPARGVLRSYFQEPTLFEQNTAKSKTPTVYQFKNESGEFLQFRPDPVRYVRHMIVPGRLDEDVDAKDLPRNLSGGNTFMSGHPLLSGVLPGDVLAIHQEVRFVGGLGYGFMPAVKTAKGSNQVTLGTPYTGAFGTLPAFTAEMVGNLFFIEEGADKGSYRVTKFIDANNILIDKELTETTPTTLLTGFGEAVGQSSSTELTYTSAATDFSGYVGKWLTFWGADPTKDGTFEITAGIPGECTLANPNASSYPFPGGQYTGFAITDAPPNPPDADGDGTKLYAVRPFRMYEGVAEEFPITGVSTNLDTPTLTLDTSTGYSFSWTPPYAIYRPNVRRVNPTEMDNLREGPFVFFDTEVVSLDPHSASNISKDSYLTAAEGTYKSTGYKHVVDDPNLTYSMKESGFLDMPTKILPVGVADSPENFLSISNTPVQITYERAEAIEALQEFINSTEDRVTAANMLARHFLPAYVSYDASYVGGSATSVVAKDIIDYIETRPVEQPIDISEIQKLITNRGGDPETPTTVVSILHDWDRKVWAEFDENRIGGSETKVPYNGTPRVSYFVPGKDVSEMEAEDVPTGERIRLTRS